VKSLVAEASSSQAQAEVKMDKLSLSRKNGLQNSLESAQSEFGGALSDSLDTPKAMRVIYDLIKDANIHISTYKASVDVQELEKVARWVTKIVGILGLDANAYPPYDGLGWASSPSNNISDPKKAVAPYAKLHKDIVGEVEGLHVDSEALDALLKLDVEAEFSSVVSTGPSSIETLSMPYLRAVSQIRDELRRLAPTSSNKKKILSLSDRIRDHDLTNLGVYLDDRSEGQPSLIKFVSKEELIAQREEKAAKEREKVAQKEAARLAREKLEQEREEKAKVNPVDMFKGDERYGAWDEEGMPTKTKDGEDVPKSQLKKLRKDWERQKKLYDEYNK
jgi:cysteinyl-tRNA synthetase